MTFDLYYTWLELLMLAVLYNVLVIIVRSVFVQHLHLNYQSTWLTFDYLCDAVYLVDMLLRAHTGLPTSLRLVPGILAVWCTYLYTVELHSTL